MNTVTQDPMCALFCVCSCVCVSIRRTSNPTIHVPWSIDTEVNGFASHMTITHRYYQIRHTTSYVSEHFQNLIHMQLVLYCIYIILYNT